MLKQAIIMDVAELLWNTVYFVVWKPINILLSLFIFWSKTDAAQRPSWSWSYDSWNIKYQYLILASLILVACYRNSVSRFSINKFNTDFESYFMSVSNFRLVCLLNILLLLFIFCSKADAAQGPSWSWSYNSSIYNYLCNQCISPLKI
jgi:hypothetical protein